MKQEKLQSVMSIIFGALIAIFGVYNVNSYLKFKETAVQTTATISNIEVREEYDRSDGETTVYHDVYVEFDVDGEKYEGELNTYHIGMKKGKTVTIYYEKDNPNNFISSNNMFGYVLLIVGGILIIIGIKGLLPSNKEDTGLDGLEKVKAKIDKVVSLGNGTEPYKIYCSYIDPSTNCQHQFESQEIMVDVEKVIKANNITTVDVYIDKKDKTEYYVDYEELLKIK